MDYLYQIVKTSGLCGGFILLVGAVAVGFFVERFVAYWRSSRGMEVFQKDFEVLAKQGKWAEVSQLCDRQKSDLAEMGKLVVAHGHRGPATLRSVLGNYIDSVVLPRLRTRIRELAMLAKIAPMLGLFGTVQGMIDAFGKIAGASGAGVDPKDLASSIGLALGTTFLGLLVAMPIVMLLSILQSIIEKFSIDLEKYSERCVHIVAEHPTPAVTPGVVSS